MELPGMYVLYTTVVYTRCIYSNMNSTEPPVRDSVPRSLHPPTRQTLSASYYPHTTSTPTCLPSQGGDPDSSTAEALANAMIRQKMRCASVSIYDNRLALVIRPSIGKMTGATLQLRNTAELSNHVPLTALRPAYITHHA